MRISGWSSDVCSSDLHRENREQPGEKRRHFLHQPARKTQHRAAADQHEHDDIQSGQTSHSAAINPTVITSSVRAEPVEAPYFSPLKEKKGPRQTRSQPPLRRETHGKRRRWAL